MKSIKKIFHKSKFTISRLSNVGLIVFVLVVFITLNILISNFALRLDLSKNKAYTLSNSSKKILSSIPKGAQITYFVSSTVPSNYRSYTQDAVDLAKEFALASKGKISFVVLDPQKDNKAKDEADKMGIPEQQFNTMGSNNFNIAKGYFGGIVKVGDKSEILPSLQNVETLEYDITSTLFHLSQKEQKPLGIMGGAGQMGTFEGQGDPYGDLRQILAQQLPVEQAPMATSAASLGLDKYASILLLGDQGTQIDEDTTKQLTQYLKSGGSIIALIDAMSVQGSVASVRPLGSIEKLLKEAGMKLKGNFVATKQGELVQLRSQNGIMFAKYPLWFKTQSFEEKNPVLSGISYLMFPYVSSIELDATSSAKPISLVKSPSASYELENITDVNPQKIEGLLSGNPKESILVASSTVGKGQITLIGSTRIVGGEFSQAMIGNIAFLLNQISNYTSNGALTGIRSRASAGVPMRQIDPNYQDFYKYLLILLGPILFVVFGILRIAKIKKQHR